MKIKYYALVLLLMVAASAAAQQQKASKKSKKFNYEEVDFEDMVHRYFGKERSDPMEGIYSVSCIITQTSRPFLSQREKVKVVERKDNYARIAILREWPGSKRDYIEVSLSYRDAKKIPIVGELNVLSEGKGFIYRHFEPDGTEFVFSMMNESAELIEAEYSEMQKRKTITYKLSYLKTYPRSQELVYNK